MRSLLRLASFVTRHPLNRDRPAQAWLRVLAWQVGSRLVPGDVAVPFVNTTRLLVRAGQTGATGNVYCGLHEYEDMALTLHLLRADDLFVDIGANVGSYTVLAGGAVGARCMSFEPSPAAFARLRDHVLLNDLSDRVSLHQVALGSENGYTRFTTGLDTVNHVMASGEPGAAATVPIRRLDDILSGMTPTLIKIDVEGFEAQVLEGAAATLAAPALLAILVELNGSATRYSGSDDAVRLKLQNAGFVPARYDVGRRAISTDARATGAGNTLFVRAGGALEATAARVRTAPTYDVAGRSV